MKSLTMRMLVFAIKSACLRVRCSAVVELGMPGNYVLEIKEGDYVIKHTLSIVGVSVIGNIYELTHKIDEWRETASVQHVVHVRSEKWYACYDPNLRRLIDLDLHKIVAFMPEQSNIIFERRLSTNARKNYLSSTLIQVP